MRSPLNSNNYAFELERLPSYTIVLHPAMQHNANEQPAKKKDQRISLLKKPCIPASMHALRDKPQQRGKKVNKESLITVDVKHLCTCMIKKKKPRPLMTLGAPQWRGISRACIQHVHWSLAGPQPSQSQSHMGCCQLHLEWQDCARKGSNMHFQKWELSTLTLPHRSHLEFQPTFYRI